MQYAVDFISECVVTVRAVSMYLIAFEVIWCVLSYSHMSQLPAPLILVRYHAFCS